MGQRKIFRYISIVLIFSISCNFSQTENRELPIWWKYQELLKENPKFSEKIDSLNMLKAKIYRFPFNYSNYIEAKENYLKRVNAILESTASDSLKVGIMIGLITRGDLINSKEKKHLLKKIENLKSSKFSNELRNSLSGYHSSYPKYKSGDTLDYLEIYSYAEKKHIPLPLSSKINIIFFWGSWCKGCEIYYSPLNNLSIKHDKNQVNVIGISLDKSKRRLKKHEKKYGFSFTSYSDLKGYEFKEYSNAKNFGVTGVPNCLVVDDEGTVLLVNSLPLYLERMVEGMLN